VIMGRAQQAQAQAQSTTANDVFAATFGTRRGVAMTDAQERALAVADREAEVERGLETFFAHVQAKGGGGDSTEELASVCRQLVVVYRQDEEAKFVLYERLFESLEAEAPRLMDALCAIIDAGDPRACPQLTKPAYDALCHYLERAASISAFSASYSKIARVVERLFWTGRDSCDYLRLQALCEALGVLLAHSQQSEEGTISEPMVAAIFDAPAGVRTKELRSWIDAFESRITKGWLTAGETATVLSESKNEKRAESIELLVHAGKIDSEEAAAMKDGSAEGEHLLLTLAARVRAQA
jgi:hypothetical protein